MVWYGLPFPVYDVTSVRGILTFIVAGLIVGLFVHLAAKLVIKKDDVHRAMLAGIYGMLAAFLGYELLTIEILGFVVALAAFCLVILFAYRTKFPQAIAVGAVAWVFWIVANILLSYAQNHFHP